VKEKEKREQIYIYIEIIIRLSDDINPSLSSTIKKQQEGTI